MATQRCKKKCKQNFTQLFLEQKNTFASFSSKMTKMKNKIKIRDFHEKDQNEAYRIWKLGMTDDLSDLFKSFYLAKKRVKITLMLLPFFGMVSGLKYGNYIGIVISLLFLLFINFYGMF